MKTYLEDGMSWLEFLHQAEYINLLKPRLEAGRVRVEAYDAKKREGCCLDLGQARVVGLGYLGAGTGQFLPEIAAQLPEKNKFTILALHAALGTMEGLEIGGLPIGAVQVLRGKSDYLALGHIHYRKVVDDWAYNPGSPECWDIGEWKYSKGWFHVAVQSGQKTVTFVPSQPRPAACLYLDVSDLEKPEELVPIAVAQLAADGNHGPKVSHSGDKGGKPCLPPGGQLQLTLVGHVDFSPL